MASKESNRMQNLYKIVQDPDNPNAILVNITGDSHTLGNLLISEACKYAEREENTERVIVFCGYSNDHPLFPGSVVRIETRGALSISYLLEVLIKIEKDVKDLKKDISSP